MKRDFIEMIYNEPEYYDIVRNTIIYISNYKISDFDLDDCISEVYLTVMQKREQLEIHPNVKGWLNVTAKFVTKRYLKKQAIENSLLTVDVENIDNENIYENIEKGELLKILKENLKVSEYKLFKMKFIEGLTNSEIADLIGKSKNSIEVRIVRLREKIKNILSLSLLRKGGITSTKT